MKTKERKGKDKETGEKLFQETARDPSQPQPQNCAALRNCARLIWRSFPKRATSKDGSLRLHSVSPNVAGYLFPAARQPLPILQGDAALPWGHNILLYFHYRTL